jgi:starch synthase
MRVLFASSEIYPLAKTGGLADVSAGLPVALADLNVDVRLLTPAYPETLDIAKNKGARCWLPGLLGFDDVSLVPARMPDTGLPVWLVDCPSLYDRDGGLYVDFDGREWPDNAVRFAMLCHAAARVGLGTAGVGWQPDIVHANDWHLGLLPTLLDADKGLRPASLLTIHNLAFQGVFTAETFPRLGLPRQSFSAGGVEYFGQVSFLKAGILNADRLSTVSPRYAQEILTPEFGCGLDGLLRTRADDLIGILNGIDYETWTPDDEATLHAPYSADDLSGKRLCKHALQAELDLKPEPSAPLFVFMSRITEQKMADVLPAVMPLILERGGQVAILGQGDRSIESALYKMAHDHPDDVSVRISYDEGGAKRLLAGADVLLAPARFEPCGLTQMYGMRYGALPVVRRVGGLADTVTHASGDAEESPTGFMFEQATAADFSEAIEGAASAYRNPHAWNRMQRRAMTRDFSWRRSAERYVSLYRDLAAAAAQKTGCEDTAESALLSRIAS